MLRAISQPSTSAGLAAALADETGTGSVVFNNSPSFTGNIGIGTVVPQGKLEVNNRNIATGAALFITGGEDDLDPIAGQYTGINFGYGGLAGYLGGGIFYEFTTAIASGKLHLAVKNLVGVGTATLADSKITILDNGNVGIGTTAPAAKLDVADTIKSTGLIQPTTGAAVRTGNAVLVAGTVTVATTAAVTASSIMLTRKTSGGTIGEITYTINTGVGFTITSANALDTSTVSFLIVDSY